MNYVSGVWDIGNELEKEIKTGNRNLAMDVSRANDPQRCGLGALVLIL
jgi:hypothetical protein